MSCAFIREGSGRIKVGPVAVASCCDVFGEIFLCWAVLLLPSTAHRYGQRAASQAHNDEVYTGVALLPHMEFWVLPQ